MSSAGIRERVKFFINRVEEQLWVKPLLMCALSITVVLVAKAADSTQLSLIVSQLSAELIDTLLSIMASSMLVIATFAVGSMVSAYSSASTTASPRAFPLLIADDISQFALSTFIGAFIFSIVGLVASKNGYYEAGGVFVLFLLTVIMFGIVIFTFVLWIDRIARLGRLGTSIHKVAAAAAAALNKRRNAPLLYGTPAKSRQERGEAVFSAKVGYVQRIDIAALQSCAEDADGRIAVAALPGTFVSPGRALAYCITGSRGKSDFDPEQVARAFQVEDERIFEDDPRYGLVVLSQIADRALSAAVNDPGTAIDILGILARLFVLWSEPVPEESVPEVKYNRIEVPELPVQGMFDDAFTAMERDGAKTIEVMVRLQKTLASLSLVGDHAMRSAAMHHARRAKESAEKALVLPEDVAIVRELARFAEE